MSDKTTVIESGNPPAPSDRTIDMAVEFGRLGAAYQTTQQELAEVRSAQSQTLDWLRSQSEVISELRNQTQSAQRTAEAAQVTAVVAVEATEEGSDSDVLSVTPETETTVTIEQKPATARKWIHNLIYGR